MDPNAIFDQLGKIVTPEIEAAFRAFLQRHKVRKWIIAADFVVGDAQRFNDVFCFTIYPDPPVSFDAFISEADFFIPRDLKRIKSVSPLTLGYMRSGRQFSFCFILDRGSVLQTAAEMDAILQGTLDQLATWPKGIVENSLSRKLRALRQKIKARGFRRRLLFDLVFYAAIAGFLAYLLCRNSAPALIMLAPDRDDMVRSFDRLADDLFACNFAAVCGQNGIDPRQTQLGIWTSEEAGMDPLIRIPDFLAGSIAAWDIQRNVVLAHHPKVHQVIHDVVAENPDVALMRLSFGEHTTHASKIVVRRTEPTPVPVRSETF